MGLGGCDHSELGPVLENRKFPAATGARRAEVGERTGEEKERSKTGEGRRDRSL